MLPKAILFDLDDTLITEEKAGDIAWEQVSEEFARETGFFDGRVFNGVLNDIRHKYWADMGNRAIGAIDIFKARVGIVKQALNRVNCDSEKLADLIVTRYATLKMEKTEHIPHAWDTVNHLKNKGIKLAVLTNGEGKEQRAKIEKFGLTDLFDACLIAGELGFGKPDTRVFNLALDRLNVADKDAWMVGDTLDSDIAGAKNAGIFSIWFNPGRKPISQVNVKPDRVIHDLQELVAI
jgi:putative hydrolase of the HAD superfamily